MTAISPKLLNLTPYTLNPKPTAHKASEPEPDCQLQRCFALLVGTPGFMTQAVHCVDVFI